MRGRAVCRVAREANITAWVLALAAAGGAAEAADVGDVRSRMDTSKYATRRGVASIEKPVVVEVSVTTVGATNGRRGDGEEAAAATGRR